MAGPTSTLGFHLPPASAAWFDAVEAFFAKPTKRRLKRGVFLSVVDLQAAINRFIIEHNSHRRHWRAGTVS
jgi:hypothetical protein